MYPYLKNNGQYVDPRKYTMELLYLKAKIMLLHAKMNKESYSDEQKQLIENLACTVEHYEKSVQ